MFILSDYLTKHRNRFEAALEETVPPPTTPPIALHAAMRYSVFSGGKRLRPILALAACECVSASCEAAFPAALAIELLHTYTLIHDDLPCMDDDAERRGKPTCHIVYGEATAILAGDALQALAFATATHSPTAPAALVRELADAAGSQGVVGGQVADIAATAGMDAAPLAFIHQHKTADLFRAAIRMGALAGDATDTQLDNLTTYGANIGLAFQIIDDIIDAADPADTSCSCIDLYGLRGARQRAAELTQTATTALTTIGAPATPLITIAEHMLKRTT